MITQQHSPRSNFMLLTHLHNRLLTEQRGSCASQRRVCSNMNALCLAEIHNFLLWQVWVVFDLVCGGHDCGLYEKFLEEGDGEVCYAYCFYFSSWDELFEGFVGVDVGN